MVVAAPDRQLLLQLIEIPEIAGSGFSVREGLTGAGVTILRGRTYFGSWRHSAGKLVWVHAHVGAENEFFDTVDEAVRYTLLLILKSLESSRAVRGQRTAAAG